MGGDGEYEPEDSREVTGGGAEEHPGERGPDWHDQPRGHGGEYEPRDSRNVTGTATTPDGRWTNTDGKAPLAAGGVEPAREGDHQLDPAADTAQDAKARAERAAGRITGE